MEYNSNDKQAIDDIESRIHFTYISISILKYYPLTNNMQCHIKIKYILELHSTI